MLISLDWFRERQVNELDVFEACQRAAKSLRDKNDASAREIVLGLLDALHELGVPNNKRPCSNVIDGLLRELGLYSYMDPSKRGINDIVLRNAFGVDLPGLQAVLHRGQAKMFSSLIENNLVVSAPTSYGKSYVVDAYIAKVRPKTVMVIVPTIALTDEIRRRIVHRFGSEYKVITNTGEELDEKTILIFPQERALLYSEKIKQLDFLVVDEFYKADPSFDDDRATMLMLAIATFLPRAKRWYLLAPNIEDFAGGSLELGTHRFLKMSEITVLQVIHEYWDALKTEIANKSDRLLKLVDINVSSKTLVYVNSHSQIKVVSELLLNHLAPLSEEDKCLSFARWLRANISEETSWLLPSLVERGVGVHTGKSNRMIAQIVLRLFERQIELRLIVSTSSIIEGVNTTARNVILWSNKKAKGDIDDFTFKNICGRAGRMFKHFVGHVYLLEKPKYKQANLSLEFGVKDEEAFHFCDDSVVEVLTESQREAIVDFKNRIIDEFGALFWSVVFAKSTLQGVSKDKAVEVARKIKENPSIIDGLVPLTEYDHEQWEQPLYNLCNLLRAKTSCKYSEYIPIIIAASSDWRIPLKEKIASVALTEGVEQYFDAERDFAFHFAACVHDLSVIIRALELDTSVDLMPFAEMLSRAFLPKVVYQLEEYGLPRMISIKLQECGLIDFESENLTMQDAIDFFVGTSKEDIFDILKLNENDFDREILESFYEGLPR